MFRLSGFLVLLSIILSCICNRTAGAEEIFKLTFDRFDRAPLSLKLYPEKTCSKIEVRTSDSVRLVRGLKGYGIYMDDYSDYLSLSSNLQLSPAQGAISFWLRPLWQKPDDRHKSFIVMCFEQGSLLLWSDRLNFSCLKPDGKWDYAPHGNAPVQDSTVDSSGWLSGSWHHVVINWSMETGQRRLFVDGVGYRALDFVSPQGKLTGFYFSRPPQEIHNNLFPACGVIDEIAVYDKPLSNKEIKSLYLNGSKLPESKISNMLLDVNAYPNLAKGAACELIPQPNYITACNDPDDKLQLSDGWFKKAYYLDKRSVGWSGVSPVVLNYDLGGLKHIGALGLNLGGGNAGVNFPKKITFYLGVTPDSLKKVGEIAISEPYPDPEYLKWHGKTVGISDLNELARFVRFEVEAASLFMDEVFIIEKSAGPAWTRVNLDITADNKGGVAR